MLRFLTGEISALVGDLEDEAAFAAALDSFPAGFRDYLSRGRSLARRRERMGAVRLLLGLCREVGVDVSHAVILVDGAGRPFFASADDPQGERQAGAEGTDKTGAAATRGAFPDFNLSHSGGFAAAVIGDGRVGIDLQQVNPNIDAAALGRRFFAEDEADAIERAAAQARRVDLFFSLWTKKEAVGKALGDGLARTLAGLPTTHKVNAERRMMGDKPFHLAICHIVEEQK